MCVCVNMYTDSNILGQCERRKTEEGEEEKRRNQSSKKRVEKEKEGKEEKIREKVADSIGGNEFKMAARDSVPG